MHTHINTPPYKAKIYRYLTEKTSGQQKHNARSETRRITRARTSAPVMHHARDAAQLHERACKQEWMRYKYITWSNKESDIHTLVNCIDNYWYWCIATTSDIDIDFDVYIFIYNIQLFGYTTPTFFAVWKYKILVILLYNTNKHVYSLPILIYLTHILSAPQNHLFAKLNSQKHPQTSVAVGVTFAGRSRGYFNLSWFMSAVRAARARRAIFVLYPNIPPRHCPQDRSPC